MEVHMEKLLSVQDVANLLNIKPMTIYLWAEQGRLKSVKFGRLLRFKEADIKDFIKNAESKGAKGFLSSF